MMLLTACPTQTTLVIPPNQPSMSRGDEQNDGSTTRLSSRGKFASPSQEALSSYPIIRCILRHIEEDFLLLGRQRRQALISQLARVSKAWVKPVNQRLYRNPYFGVAGRAVALYDSLLSCPERGDFIQKLIFGEGSNTDIEDWPSHHLVPNIIRATNNLEIIAFDGLHNVDLEDFKSALHSRKKLCELRACDKMPAPWCFVGHAFDEIFGPIASLKRFRLYSLKSESDRPYRNKNSLLSPRPLNNRAFTDVAFNHCSLNHQEIRNILEGSRTSLQTLYLEFPNYLFEDDLVSLIKYVGKNLKSLSVHDFASSLPEDQLELRRYIVEDILNNSPELTILNFPDAMAGIALFEMIIKSKLKLWSFSCSKEVRPSHWLEAFKKSGFPRNASCRVYVKGWTAQEIRHVRIEAHKIGLNWLTSRDTLTNMCEDFLL